MRMSSSVGYALSAAAAISLLAGCSGSGSPVAPAQNSMVATQMVNGHVLQRSYSVLPKSMQNAIRPVPARVVVNRKKHHHPAVDVYISSFSSSLVACYDNTDKKGVSDGTLTSGLINPQGEAADGKNLVIANTGAHNILEFSGECGATLTRTMNDATGYPVGVSRAGDGNIYVTNIFDSAGNGEVRLYKPTDNNGVQIGDPNLIDVYFVGVNAADTLICADGIASAGYELDCSTNGGSSWVNTGIPVTFPGGIVLDNAGNMIFDDQSKAAPSIVEYSGSGSSWTATGNTETCDSTDCVNISMGKGDKSLYAGDAGSNIGGQYDWGGAGSFDFGDPSGGSSTISAQPVPGQ